MKADKAHVCPHRLSFLLDNWLRRLLTNPQRIVSEYIKPGHTVIDLGCGPGFFTIDMAKLVGKNGQVIAVDLQEHMLEQVRKKAAKHNFNNITLHKCSAHKLDLETQADFILAYYMVHEYPDQCSFFKQVHGLLAGNGIMLVVEPRMHVSKKKFKISLQQAESNGFTILERPQKKGGMSALLGLQKRISRPFA